MLFMEIGQGDFFGNISAVHYLNPCSPFEMVGNLVDNRRLYPIRQLGRVGAYCVNRSMKKGLNLQAPTHKVIREAKRIFGESITMPV